MKTDECRGLAARSALAVSPRCFRQIRLVAAAACACCLLPLSHPRSLPAQEPSGPAVAAALENLLVDAIARSEKSVVAIARVDNDDAAQGQLKAIIPSDPSYVPDGYGTGVIVGRDGLILTYYHVLGLKSRHFVTTCERKTYPAHIKAADPRSDLAVLEIEASNLSPIPLGDAATVKKGQIVVALGNPYAIASDGQASASWGIVSNLGRKVGPRGDDEAAARDDHLYHHGSLIQTDAKLNLGTSGGALLNLKGEMIGLTTSLAATPGYEQAAGYAMPVDDMFRRVVDTLKEGREVEYGYLGVLPENVEGARGARIEHVESGSPAERSGVKKDDVVTQINGQPIFDKDGLMLQVGRLPVEATVQLTVLRNGEKLPIRVELSKFPVRGTKVVTRQAPSWRGLRVDYASALPPRPFMQPDPDGCVVVTEIEPGSPAADGQLQVGMYINRVDSVQVRTPREFRAAVANKTGDVSLRLWTLVDPPETRTVKPKAG